MKKIIIKILALTLLITVASSAFTVSAESAVTQYGEAKAVSSTLPVIDGKIDDVWANANAYYMGIIKVGEDTGIKGYFSILWNSTTLYVLAVVPDKTPNHEADEDYKRDTLEVPLDFSNARTEAYENDDQMNLRFYGNGDAMLVARDGNGTVLDEYITWAVTQSGEGYIYEFSVACDKLGITLNADKVIGFDSQINDNAEGIGERKACYAWNDDADAGYNNPTYMGEIKLVSTSADIVPETVEDTAAPADTANEAPVSSAPAQNTAPKTSDDLVIPLILIMLSAVAFVIVKKTRVR